MSNRYYDSIPDAPQLAEMVRTFGIRLVADDYGVGTPAISSRLRLGGYTREGYLTGVSEVDPIRRRRRDEQRWSVGGVCGQTDPDAWFPEMGQPNVTAKALCASCDVTQECLQYALDHNEDWGVWGGASEQERREMKRKGVAA